MRKREVHAAGQVDDCANKTGSLSIDNYYPMNQPSSSGLSSEGAGYVQKEDAMTP